MNPDHIKPSSQVISAYDVAPATRAQAARVVASNAHDADDLRLLFDALGLDAADLVNPTEVTP